MGANSKVLVVFALGVVALAHAYAAVLVVIGLVSLFWLGQKVFR